MANSTRKYTAILYFNDSDILGKILGGSWEYDEIYVQTKGSSIYTPHYKRTNTTEIVRKSFKGSKNYNSILESLAKVCFGIVTPISESPLGNSIDTCIRIAHHHRELTEKRFRYYFSNLLESSL